MPLRFEHYNGQTRPIIVCDFCSQEIRDAKNGNYEFPMPLDNLDKPQVSDAYFTHKRCSLSFEDAIKPKYSEKVIWGTCGLECLTIYLENNLKIDRKAAMATAALMSGRFD